MKTLAIEPYELEELYWGLKNARRHFGHMVSVLGTCRAALLREYEEHDTLIVLQTAETLDAFMEVAEAAYAESLRAEKKAHALLQRPHQAEAPA